MLGLQVSVTSGPRAPGMEPTGSKYPILEASGSQNHTLNGIWDQRPCMTQKAPSRSYLSTLRPKVATIYVLEAFG